MMYEFMTTEKLNKLYPILETKATAILNFTSIDGNMSYKLSAVLTALRPQMKYNYQKRCFEGKVSKGDLIMNASQKPFIINMPYKESYRHKCNQEYVEEGIKKISESYKSGKLKVESIAIQRGIIDDIILLPLLDEYELPEIILYDEYNYYDELAEETKKRKEEEKLIKKMEKEAKKITKKQLKNKE